MMAGCEWEHCGPFPLPDRCMIESVFDANGAGQGCCPRFELARRCESEFEVL